uniref:Glyoxylate reductase/hydroxypyruvate reductase n=1 Tax=Strigamia maritima TaxID=126957 RepID=T1J7Q1_STRMM
MSTLRPIFISRPDVPEAAVKMLRDSFDVALSPQVVLERKDFLGSVAGKHGLFCFTSDTIDEELLQAAGPELKVVCTMSVGYDHIDIEACKKRGIQVGNTPDVLTDAVAELTVALLLATSRRLIEASQEVTNGGWRRINKWSPMYMTGPQLKGSTVGVVGLGRIGFAVCQRLKPFRVNKFLYSGRSAKPYASEIDAEYVPFEDLLRNSDFVIVTCALTKETKGLFDAKAFGQMKSNAIFINISRGAVVDQDALYEALVLGKIHAAGLDVTTPEPLPEDHPLTKLKNCVILPHIASATKETRSEMAMLTAKNLITGLKGLEMPAKLC